MKNLLKYAVLLLILLAIIPLETYAKENKKPEVKMESAEATVLTNRLLEIKNMDLSTKTRAEKKALRKEVKSINTNLAVANGGVYLTTGAIIIIILLLILIL